MIKLSDTDVEQILHWHNLCLCFKEISAPELKLSVSELILWGRGKDYATSDVYCLSMSLFFGEGVKTYDFERGVGVDLLKLPNPHKATPWSMMFHEGKI